MQSNTSDDEDLHMQSNTSDDEDLHMQVEDHKHDHAYAVPIRSLKQKHEDHAHNGSDDIAAVLSPDPDVETNKNRSDDIAAVLSPDPDVETNKNGSDDIAAVLSPDPDVETNKNGSDDIAAVLSPDPDVETNKNGSDDIAAVLSPDPDVETNKDDNSTSVDMQSPGSQSQQPDLDNNQLHPGYQVVFDNVNIYQKRRHKTSQNKNEQHNLVQLYAVLDRINCEDLPDEAPILPDVRELGRDTWWLPATEQLQMKQEIEVLISRVITDYLKCLKHLKPIVQQHIPHKNSTQTVIKSDVNKLGLLKLDEMQSGDMIEIMTTVEDQCCPKTMERLYQILLGGDGLSTFNAWSAKRGRADGFNATDSLAGIIPKPEDWHEGVICLQDVFTYGYIHKSTCEKGTLYNLREVFDRRGVKASAKNAVNDNREFLKFITHGYVVLAAMQVLGIDEFEESPVGIPSQQDPVEVRQAYLQEISSAIVDRFVFPHGFFHLVVVQQIIRKITSTTTSVLSCGKDSWTSLDWMP
ncbi:uncharacterized protein [Amphiura filiformis]